ncbi:MAG: hypothetical protein ACT4OJ_09355 [Bacteroidota bacterium]
MKDLKDVKNELQNIIYGKSGSGESDFIQTAKAYLRNNSQAGRETKKAEQIRPEEERALKEFAISNSLLLHNYFFPDTSYFLTGFIEEGDSFFAVVRQQFVLNTEITSLETVKNHLLANGFLHKKNNDYYHPELGIILEDLHDENVLTNSGTLFFVNTVFYLTATFHEKNDNHE